MDNPRTYTTLVLQYDYNGKRSGEPDNWEWIDAGFVLKGDTDDEKLEMAKDYVTNRAGSSKFIRGYRVIRRTTVTTDELVEELQQEGNDK